MNVLKGTLFASLLALPALALAVATPGEPAPAFSETDAQGNTHSLSDYEGEWLVLEWFNKDCPYVRKHYGSGNMQSLQEEYTEKDVNWLTVISSAEGKQGYLEPDEAQKEAKAHNLNASAPFLLDPNGDMGRAYGAKTTPHMYIINPDGDVVYAGAIDDNDSANPAVIPDSHNYVAAALDQAMAGKPVETASSQAYGCSVKY
ncbi:thioredoxin family protein [Marinimicrobium agarilyticum]|uniref:thioredoxin family protein n=1 Tax=Marinimicrobium agarilyticum TaxID=306546 RepID=UPI00040F0CB8|nr:thioredoxin family protein [Marinimicrobium agarilyticum]